MIMYKRKSASSILTNTNLKNSYINEKCRVIGQVRANKKADSVNINIPTPRDLYTRWWPSYFNK